MASIETTVAAYGASMRRERRAPNGIRRYMDSLRHLVTWGGDREVRGITKADLSDYQVALVGLVRGDLRQRAGGQHRQH